MAKGTEFPVQFLCFPVFAATSTEIFTSVFKIQVKHWKLSMVHVHGLQSLASPLSFQPV